MTQHEKVVLSAYTGILMCDIDLVNKYITKILGRPVFTHELNSEEIWEEIREKSKEDFMAVVAPEEDKNLFNQYLARLSDISRNVSHENFVEVQKVQADILNSYTDRKLSGMEKASLYTASTIIMSNIRKALQPKTWRELDYKGFHGKYQYSEEDDTFVGVVTEGTTDSLYFSGVNIYEVESSFRSLIDDYIAMREALRQKGEDHGTEADQSSTT